MRTRLTSLALLLALLVLPVAAASASTAPAARTDTIVLAAEGGGGGEAPGLDPATADDPDNEFAPEDYERPWTYWLGVFVLASTIPALLLLGLLYYALVHRHRDPAKAGAS